MHVRVRLLVGLAWVSVLVTDCASDHTRQEHPMHAELTIDGGVGFFPGLARPIVLDEKDLSSGQSEEFSRLVSAARAEAAAAPGATTKAVPDGRTYRISIAFEGDRVKLESADPSIPHGFAALMTFVKEHGHR
jgi:hypothetical protein